MSGRSRNRRSDWLVLLAAGVLVLLVVGVAAAHTATVSMACSAQAGASLRINGSAYPTGSTFTYSIDGGATSGSLNANTGGTISYYAGVPTISHSAIVQFNTSDGLTQYNYVFTPSVPACVAPTAAPTAQPTAEPTAEPTAQPTAEPTAVPTAEPTAQPTAAPSQSPGSSVLEATGSPATSLPPTDGLVVAAQAAGTGLTAVIGAGIALLLALVLLTPARRRRPTRR
jgi:hypothetical protein